MAKYLFQVNYIGEGIKGLLKEGGSSRGNAVEKLVKSAGGTIESFYYAFGDTDLYVIADFPDHAAVTSLVLTVTATGGITCRTTVLMKPEEIDEAVKKTLSYRPPGQ